MQEQGLNVTTNLPFSHASCSFIFPFHYLLCRLLLHTVSFTQAPAHTARKACCVYEAEGEGMILRYSVDRTVCFTSAGLKDVAVLLPTVLLVSALYVTELWLSLVTDWSVKRRSTFKCDAAFSYLRIIITQGFNTELFTSLDSRMICFYGNTRNTERASKYLITQLIFCK